MIDLDTERRTLLRGERSDFVYNFFNENLFGMLGLADRDVDIIEIDQDLEERC